jgi:hypothetical protein
MKLWWSLKLKAVLLSVLQCLHMLLFLSRYESSFSLCWCLFLHPGHTPRTFIWLFGV